MKALFTVLALFVAVFASVASGQYLTPTEYLSLADSPFDDAGTEYFHLETFETGSLAAPGVVASAGTIASPGPQTDSVDGDGVIDGSGVDGFSWYSNGVNSVSFTFDVGALGRFPDHVGLAVTDVGFTTSGTLGVGEFQFLAYDGNGDPIGGGTSFEFGDGDVGGTTAEDRFVGLQWPAGISRVDVGFADSADWEVDHLQYGAVPEPASLTLALLGIAALRRTERA